MTFKLPQGWSGRTIYETYNQLWRWSAVVTVDKAKECRLWSLRYRMDVLSQLLPRVSSTFLSSLSRPCLRQKIDDSSPFRHRVGASFYQRVGSNKVGVELRYKRFTGITTTLSGFFEECAFFAPVLSLAITWFFFIRVCFFFLLSFFLSFFFDLILCAWNVNFANLNNFLVASPAMNVLYYKV